MSEVNQSESESNTIEQADQPKPLWLEPKIIAATLGGMVIIILLVLWFGSDDTTIETETGTSIVGQSQPAKALGLNKESRTMMDVEKEETLDTGTHFIERNNAINDNKKNNENNAIKIQELSKAISEMQLSVKQITTTLATQDGKIKAMNSQLVSLDTLYQKQAASQIKRAVSKKIKRKRISSRIPFTLLSIDRWGETLWAVVQLNNEFHDLEKGQILERWRVENINTDARSVEFSSGTGSRQTLYVKS